MNEIGFWNILAWAHRCKTGGPGTKAVLTYLATRCNDYGLCFAGQPRIAEETEASERSVRRYLDVLVENGLITRIRRHRENGSRRSEAYFLHFVKASTALAALDEEDVLPDWIPELVPALKALMSEQNTQEANLAGRRGNESQEANLAGSEKDSLPDTVTKKTDTVSALELPSNTPSTPSNFPSGKDSVFELIDGYQPTPEWLEEISVSLDVPEAFVLSTLPKWRDVAKAGGRIRSHGVHFRNWLKRRKDRDAMLKRWMAAKHPTTPPEPEKHTLRPETVFATKAGLHALDQEVGKQFLQDCQDADQILSRDYVTDLFEERQYKFAAPKDDVEAKCQSITQEAEFEFSKYWLGKVRAVG